MGARSGGGAGFGGGGTSDAAISRLANMTSYDRSGLDPTKNPQILSGEVMVKQAGGMVISVYKQNIEKPLTDVAESAPAKPSSKKGNAKYVKDYNAWHDKMQGAYQKAIDSYKKEIGSTKHIALKVGFAKQVVQLQTWKQEAVGVKNWINKVYAPK